MTVIQPRYSARYIAERLGRPSPTDEQVAVIEAPLEPQLVVAGAGSGKTDTMASRVVWLVANELVRPSEILGLTFTRKAAGELAERVSGRLRILEQSGLWAPRPSEDDAEVFGDIPTISTYNAYAGRIVGDHGLRLGIEPDARLLSEAARWQLAHDVVASYDGPMDAVDSAASTVIAGVLGTAGELSEHLATTDDLRQFYADALADLDAIPFAPRKSSLRQAGIEVRGKANAHTQVLALVDLFIEAKKREGALDFSDQIRFAAKLAMDFPLVGVTERTRYKVVLLDEFQDTSEAQINFLAALFARGENRTAVTAVGDPHQSIFGWRGASATTLAKFRHDFALPGHHQTSAVSLSTSWRNDAAILKVANCVAGPLMHPTDPDAALIADQVPVRELDPRPGAGTGYVFAARLETDVDEAAYVADWIGQQRSGGRRSAAVLCRRRAQFVPIMEELIARGIPCEAVGLGGLLQTPEVVDLLSLLWVVDDPGRGDHFMRLLTGSSLRFGAHDIAGLSAWARELGRRYTEQARAARRETAPPASLPVEAQDMAPLPADGDRPDAETSNVPREEVSIIEALDDLPEAGWTSRDGESLSETALARLRGFAHAISRLRQLTGLPLADFVGEAERVLGLDIEVMAQPDRDSATARAHLDAFADIAGTFSAQSDRPTLGAFLAWLEAAVKEERGLELPALEMNTDAVQVLTVHAAKGLEWDVVAIPGLNEGYFPSIDGRVKAKDDEWCFTPHGGSAWLTGIRSIPFPLRGDRAGLPKFDWKSVADSDEFIEAHAEFKLKNQEHAVLEERRLAYVAFTRARAAMLLTACVWSSGVSPRMPSRFLTEILENNLAQVLSWAELPPVDINGEKPVNPLEQNQVFDVWPPQENTPLREELTRGAERVREFAEIPDGEQQDLELDLLLAERTKSRETQRQEVALPLHLSASAVVALSQDPEQFARRLRRPMPSEPALAARRGTAFHAWVEEHYQQAPLVDIDELPGFADDDAPADVDLDALKSHFLSSEWAEQTPIALEVPLETVVEGYAIRGRIDAVFKRPDGGVTIVDWKTGRRPSDVALEHKSLQLAAYALAYARSHNLSPDQVDAAFFYAASGETYRPTLQPVEALSKLLRNATESDDMRG